MIDPVHNPCPLPVPAAFPGGRPPRALTTRGRRPGSNAISWLRDRSKPALATVAVRPIDLTIRRPARSGPGPRVGPRLRPPARPRTGARWRLERCRSGDSPKQSRGQPRPAPNSRIPRVMRAGHGLIGVGLTSRAMNPGRRARVSCPRRRIRTRKRHPPLGWRASGGEQVPGTDPEPAVAARYVRWDSVPPLVRSATQKGGPADHCSYEY